MHNEGLPAYAGWAGPQAGVGGTLGRRDALGGLQGPDLAGQLLAMQLQRLSLCSHVHSDPLQLGNMHLRFRHASSLGSSNWGDSASSPPPPLNPGLLAIDLLGQLHMGAGATLSLPGLPPGNTAAAAYLAQQQQGQEPAGRRRGGGRNEEKVRRTVYISDISESCTEAQLAGFFRDCGQLVDVRVCGDPNSAMRFAFIEFTTEHGALQALSKGGSILGNFPIRVSPSKTAIVPVNNTYLPRSTEERELVARTVFVGNVDRVVERDQLRGFFGNLCGPVSKVRLLGESQHASKIAFVEFATADSARAALKLSGALLGTLPLRVSPSKTPVRFDARRSSDVHIPSAGVPLAVRGVRAGMPLLPAHMGVRLQGAPLPQQAMSAGTPQQFPPALLMAAAGQMYAGGRFW